MTRLKAWLWLPLTTSTLTVSPVLIVIGLVMTLSNAAYLDPYWLDISSKATTSVLVLAPGFAALGAWDSARWRGLTQAAVRSPGSLLLGFLWVVAVASAVTFLIAALILYLSQPPRAGWLRADVLLAEVIVVCGYGTFGFGLGRFLPRMTAGPLAFLGVWLWVAFTPSIQPFWLRNITGNLGTSCCALDTELRSFALAAPVMVTASIAIATFIVLTWTSTRSAWFLSLALVGISVGGAGLAMAGSGADPVRPRSGTQICAAGSGSQFCVWPEHQQRLQHAAPALAATVAELRAVGLAVPTTLRENIKDPYGWSFSLSANDPSAWARILATSPLDALPPACTDDNGGVWPAGERLGLASAWLATIAGVPTVRAAKENDVPESDLIRILAMPKLEQGSWFNAARRSMNSCGPI